MIANPHAQKVIQSLGGTAAVARLLEIKSPSVSRWKQVGIPKARVMYLRIAYPQELKGIDLQAATYQSKAK